MFDLSFELSSGKLYTSAQTLQNLERGGGSPNLRTLRTIGRLLLADEREIGSQPDSRDDQLVVPLGKLLLAKEPEIKTGDYGRLDTNSWNLNDYIEYGRWLNALVTPPGRVKSLLSARLIIRADNIGIGVPLHRIDAQMRFSTPTNYYYSLGAAPKYEAHIYDHWTRLDKANYLEELFLSMPEAARGGKRLDLEVKRQAELGRGPAITLFYENGERIRKLLALRGYFDGRNTSIEDYVQLGVKFARANGGTMPSSKAYDKLSKSRRLPTWRTITNKFCDPVSGNSYPGLVRAAYQEWLESSGLQIFNLRQACELGEISPLIFEGTNDAQELIARYAKWRVVNALLPNLDTSLKSKIASLAKLDNFQAELLCYDAVKDSQIEEAAQKLGVYEIIFEDYMNYLRLP